MAMASPALAAQIPSIDYPYATYRQQMMQNGYVRDKSAPTCGPYPETCVGNRIGTASWMHPISGSKLKLTLWPCKQGWCLAPPLQN